MSSKHSWHHALTMLVFVLQNMDLNPFPALVKEVTNKFGKTGVDLTEVYSEDSRDTAVQVVHILLAYHSCACYLSNGHASMHLPKLCHCQCAKRCMQLNNGQLHHAMHPEFCFG